MLRNIYLGVIRDMLAFSGYASKLVKASLWNDACKNDKRWSEVMTEYSVLEYKHPISPVTLRRSCHCRYMSSPTPNWEVMRMKVL